MEKRKLLNSPRLLELKRRRQRIVVGKIIVSLFGILILIAGAAYLSRLESLQIKEVSIAGNKIIDTNLIKEVVDEKMSGYYLWFFPRKNVFLYPKKSIQETLSTRYKRLSDIELKIENKNALEITVVEREPAYMQCASGNTVESLEVCHFMDKDGYVFDVAPYFSGSVYFKFYGEIPEKDFGRVVSFKEILEQMGLKPESLHLVDLTEAYITLPSAQNNIPKIMFKVESDLEKMAENLQAALITEPLLSDFKNKYSKLEYIDLRFGNKVYYKFQ